MAIELRDYQRETVDKVVSLYKQNPHGAAKFVWATGLGKTVGFSAIAHEIRQYSDTNVLIIAHRDELLSQAAEKYHFIDPSAVIGKVGGGIFEWGAPVTVASIQTISRDNHLKQLKLFNYGLVIVDECHHVTSTNEYSKVLEALPDAFRIGVTATDMRLDGRSNTSIFGEAVVTYGIRWAIRHGHLCNLRAIAIKTETSLDDIKTGKNSDGETDYRVGELENAIDTEARNQRIVDAWKEHANGRRTICFGVTIKHAQNLTRAFTEQGVAAATITGETSPEERKRLYKGLADGTIQVLSSVQVLTEGFDSPRVNCILLARPTQSESLFIQIVGRGLRLAPGKADCLLLDITDNCYNHKLEPMSLSKALGIKVKDNESVIEAEARTVKENAEKQAQVRKLHTYRSEDKEVNLLEIFAWQERADGLFVLEVGRERHRIALVPEEDDQYTVWARLFPGYEAQAWIETPMPLDWAQNFAEKKAAMLRADPKATALVDRNASWRNYPIDPDGKQAKFLNWKRIPWTNKTTKGEAADLIDAWKQQDEAKKAAKEARQKAKAMA